MTNELFTTMQMIILSPSATSYQTSTFKKSVDQAIQWFDHNSMKVNPSKFQAIVLHGTGRKQYIQEFRLSQGTVIRLADHVKL